MRAKLWGIRGSLPTPQQPEHDEQKIRQFLNSFVEFQKKKNSSNIDDFLSQYKKYQISGFGGNTACIEVSTPKQSLIVDAGSGIRRLGEQLMMGPCGEGMGEVHLLMTHFHWDHIIGLPFFVPVFIPGNKLYIYSVQEDAEETFKTIFKKPNFPVPYEGLGAEIIYRQIEPRKPIEFQDMVVTPYQLDHPDPCWGYKFQYGDKALAYCVDTEGVRVSREELGEDLPLYQNVDCMIFDAQYTFLEAAEKVDWGHSSAPIGLDIAMREGIEKVVFVHHDPNSSDSKIAEAIEQTRDYYEARLTAAKSQGKSVNEVDWEFAIEDMIIDF